MPSSTRFAVAVHVLVVLANRPGEAVPSALLAGSVNTNSSVVRRILSQMAQVGITSSQLGTGGGAILARKAEKISLRDVYQAVENHTLVPYPRAKPNKRCLIGCHIHQILEPHVTAAEKAFEATLDGVTIADLLAELEARAEK